MELSSVDVVSTFIGNFPELLIKGIEIQGHTIYRNTNPSPVELFQGIDLRAMQAAMKIALLAFVVSTTDVPPTESNQDA